MKSNSLEKFRVNLTRKHTPLTRYMPQQIIWCWWFLVICLSFRQSVTRMNLAKKRKGLERRSHLEVIPSTSPVRWQWILQISQLGNLTRKLVITRSLWTFFFRFRGKGPRILPQIIQTVCICWNFVIAQHCPSCCLLVGYTHKQERTRKERRRRRRTSCYNFSESLDHFL
jgi:hypothetical protein